MGMYAYVVYAKLSVYVYIHTHVYIVYAKLSVLLELTLKKKNDSYCSPPPSCLLLEHTAMPRTE